MSMDSPNMLSTMIHGQAFRIVDLQPPLTGPLFYPSPEDTLSSYTCLSPWKFHQYPEKCVKLYILCILKNIILIKSYKVHNLYSGKTADVRTKSTSNEYSCHF